MVRDNMTTLYYINKQGGTHSLSLLYLSIHLWEWCYDHHLFPVAIHVATENNNVSDHLSRLTTQTHKWVLDDSVFAWHHLQQVGHTDSTSSPHSRM